MDPIYIADLCLRLFPDAEHLYGREMLIKDPQLAIRVTAVHLVHLGQGAEMGEDYEAFRLVIDATHGTTINIARDARKEASEKARLESIRASIRQKRTNARKGRPGDHGLTEEEKAVEEIDSKAK